MYSAMEEGEDLGTWLGLGIGGSGSADPRRSHGDRRPPSTVQLGVLLPQHVVKEERRREEDEQEMIISKKGEEQGRARVQRIRIGHESRSSRGLSLSDGGGSDGGGGTRKKLQLSKEQSTLLEESFRVHNILSHGQKHELARQLNLRPRQVEVWFQNRRARTKLKQTEVDCGYLKQCCESLTDENQRLKHELMELRRLAAATAATGPRLYDVQFPRAAAASMVNVCPSCEKVTVIGGETSGKSSSY